MVGPWGEGTITFPSSTGRRVSDGTIRNGRMNKSIAKPQNCDRDCDRGSSFVDDLI